MTSETTTSQPLIVQRRFVEYLTVEDASGNKRIVGHTHRICHLNDNTCVILGSEFHSGGDRLWKLGDTDEYLMETGKAMHSNSEVVLVRAVK